MDNRYLVHVNDSIKLAILCSSIHSHYLGEVQLEDLREKLLSLTHVDAKIYYLYVIKDNPYDSIRLNIYLNATKVGIIKTLPYHNDVNIDWADLADLLMQHDWVCYRHTNIVDREDVESPGTVGRVQLSSNERYNLLDMMYTTIPNNSIDIANLQKHLNSLFAVKALSSFTFYSFSSSKEGSLKLNISIEDDKKVEWELRLYNGTLISSYYPRIAQELYFHKWYYKPFATDKEEQDDNHS